MRRLLVLLALATTACSVTTRPVPLALTGGTIYTSPDAAPIRDGVVLMRGSRIVAVGPRDRVAVPRGANRIDCSGSTVTAGFWNSHVHFFGDDWDAAVAKVDDAKLAKLLEETMVRWGFTSVVDTGSLMGKAQKIRDRIESGAVPGPAILTTGPPIFPKGGTPKIVIDHDPVLREAVDEAEARRLAGELSAAGVDAIKIYIVGFLGLGHKVIMPPELVSALADEARKHGKFAFAHPGTPKGWQSAIDARVDVIVHSNPNPGAYVDGQIAQIVKQGTAVIPTLTLFRFDSIREGDSKEESLRIERQAGDWLRKFVNAGGTVLFGTDIGWITQYDTTEEFEQMAAAGMTFPQILRSLTVAPATRFNQTARKGVIEPGKDADVVVLRGDPASDPRAFARVAATIRRGQVLYRAQ